MAGCSKEEEEDNIEEGKDSTLSLLSGIRSLNKLFLYSNNLDKLLELLLKPIKRGSKLEEAIRID